MKQSPNGTRQKSSCFLNKFLIRQEKKIRGKLQDQTCICLRNTAMKISRYITEEREEKMGTIRGSKILRLKEKTFRRKHVIYN